jgi:carbamoyltransferase
VEGDNGKIPDVTPFKDVFLTSCPDDSGTSVGAALWLHAQRTRQRHVEPMRHNYWGPEYSDQQCLEVACKYKIQTAEVVEDPAAQAARDLVDGKIVGWMQRRMEFGQRVLVFRPDKREIVPAVVHADGSGRVQTIDADTSPRFHALVRAYVRITK